jgi:hypothetical protein
MSSYPFPNVTVNKPGACDAAIRSHINWVSNYNGLSTGPLTIYTGVALTDAQLSDLTVFVNGYTDPAVFLAFDHSVNFPLHTHTTLETDLTFVDNKAVLQTLIFEASYTNNTVVLDSIKTVVEYICPNVHDFISSTSGNISLEIFDITRNTSICSDTIELNEIASGWNTFYSTRFCLSLSSIYWITYLKP